MSFTDRLVIWLHVAFVVFTIGPVSIAICRLPGISGTATSRSFATCSG